MQPQSPAMGLPIIEEPRIEVSGEEAQEALDLLAQMRALGLPCPPPEEYLRRALVRAGTSLTDETE